MLVASSGKISSEFKTGSCSTSFRVLTKLSLLFFGRVSGNSGLPTFHVFILSHSGALSAIVNFDWQMLRDFFRESLSFATSDIVRYKF